MKKLLLPLLITSTLTMTACCEECKPTQGNLAEMNNKNTDSPEQNNHAMNKNNHDGNKDGKKHSFEGAKKGSAIAVGLLNWDKVTASSADVATLGAFPYFKTPKGMELVIGDGSAPATQPASKALDATTLHMFDGDKVVSEEGKLSYLNFIMAKDGKAFDKDDFDNTVTHFMKSIGAVEFYSAEIPTEVTEVIIEMDDDKGTYNQEYMHGKASDFNGRHLRQFAVNHTNGKLLYQVMSDDNHGEVGVMEVKGFKAPVLIKPVTVPVEKDTNNKQATDETNATNTVEEKAKDKKPDAPKVETRVDETDKAEKKAAEAKDKANKVKADKVTAEKLAKTKDAKNESKKPTASEMTEQISKSGKMVLNIKFDSAKATIKKSDVVLVDEIYKMMIKDLNLKLSIEGYTDSSGEKIMNQKLSRARAREVKAELEKKGIESNRLKAKGYGESSPIAKNDSAKGRAKNRRVELVKFN